MHRQLFFPKGASLTELDPQKGPESDEFGPSILHPAAPNNHSLSQLQDVP
jgi:hypothetical protein